MSLLIFGFLIFLVFYIFTAQFYLSCPKCKTRHNKMMECESKHTIEEKTSFWQDKNGVHNSKFQIADYVMKCKNCGHRWKQRSWDYY